MYCCLKTEKCCVMIDLDYNYSGWRLNIYRSFLKLYNATKQHNLCHNLPTQRVVSDKGVSPRELTVIPLPLTTHHMNELCHFMWHQHNSFSLPTKRVSLFAKIFQFLTFCLNLLKIIIITTNLVNKLLEITGYSKLLYSKYISKHLKINYFLENSLY